MPGLRKALIAAAFLIALGAAMLHMRIHPVYEAGHAGGPHAAGHEAAVFSLENLFANAICLVDVVVVTALFCSARTAPLAYLLNGMFVIFGTIFMVHFGIADILVKFREHGPTVQDWLLKSTLADVVILWADFLIGKAIYESYGVQPAADPA